MHGYRAKAAFFLLAGVLALGLVGLAWAIGPGSSEAQQDAMHNCPQAGKWAISVWDGADGTDTSEALATCGEGAVDFAYYIDPDTQQWLRYFAARTDISNLLTLDNMQGMLAYGAPTAAAGEVAAVGSLSATQGAEQMHNCPQAGKWAISVWDGADGTDTSEALATCGEGAVDFAYYVDPDTQQWLRYFAARTDISNLLTLDNMQGVLAYGAAVAVPERTPVSGEVTITGELVGIFSYYYLEMPAPLRSTTEMDYWPAIEDETGKFTMLRAPGMVLHASYDEERGFSLSMTIAGYTYTHSSPFKDERIRKNVWLGRTGKRVRVTGVLEVGALTPLLGVREPIKADVIHVTSIEEVP